MKKHSHQDISAILVMLFLAILNGWILSSTISQGKCTIAVFLLNLTAMLVVSAVCIHTLVRLPISVALDDAAEAERKWDKEPSNANAEDFLTKAKRLDGLLKK